MIARSFARIHRRNLIAQGIVPLTFADPSQQQILFAGQRLELPGIRGALERGNLWSHVLTPESREILVDTTFTAREREVLLVGGLLAHLRRTNLPFRPVMAVDPPVQDIQRHS